LRSGLTVSVAMVDVMYLPYPPCNPDAEENGLLVGINTN
jgi:hypothetical protein